MVQFKNMLETFNRKGILTNQGATNRLGSTDPYYTQFLENLERCQHFVFTHKEGPVKDAEAGVAVEELDLPFRAVSIEPLGENHAITVSRPEDLYSVSIRCIYVIEKSPKNYTVFAYTEALIGSEVIKEVVLVKSTEDYLLNIVQDYLERLSKEKEGVAQVRDKLKVGSGKAKRFHTIRRIIYVTPKKEVEALSGVISRTIDWSQRWLVRGHWRKNTGVGKDREGDYCIQNFTWVTEHAKGPEAAPLIQKTRIVQA